jgi:hypothetical protein
MKLRLSEKNCEGQITVIHARMAPCLETRTESATSMVTRREGWRFADAGHDGGRWSLKDHGRSFNTSMRAELRRSGSAASRGRRMPVKEGSMGSGDDATEHHGRAADLDERRRARTLMEPWRRCTRRRAAEGGREGLWGGGARRFGMRL